MSDTETTPATTTEGGTTPEGEKPTLEEAQAQMAEAQEGQKMRRMPGDGPEVGPFFPSGMGTQEAAMAGATANLSDKDKESIDKLKEQYPEFGGGSGGEVTTESGETVETAPVEPQP